SPAALSLLAKAGIPVLRLTSPRDFGEVWANVLLVGDAVGRADQARALVEEAERKIRRARARSPHRRLRVLYLTRGGYSFGPDTVGHAILDAAVATNVAAELGVRGHAPVALERLVTSDPDVI